MKSSEDYTKSGKKIIKNSLNKNLKEEIINKAFQFHTEGKVHDAAKYYKKFINQGFIDHRVFSNYGLILQGINKLKEAEILYHKSIALNPNYEIAYFNLGNLFRDLGKLEKAEISYQKAIELNPNLV